LRVSENANQPPTDIAMLQARLATVLAERDAVIAERDQPVLGRTLPHAQGDAKRLLLCCL
jgi:hypothetical protein